jgi:hypothetical protein
MANRFYLFWIDVLNFRRESIFSDGSNELSQHLEASSMKCTRQLIFPDKSLVIFLWNIFIHIHNIAPRI